MTPAELPRLGLGLGLGSIGCDRARAAVEILSRQAGGKNSENSMKLESMMVLWQKMALKMIVSKKEVFLVSSKRFRQKLDISACIPL